MVVAVRPVAGAPEDRSRGPFVAAEGHRLVDIHLRGDPVRAGTEMDCRAVDRVGDGFVDVRRGRGPRRIGGDGRMAGMAGRGDDVEVRRTDLGDEVGEDFLAARIGDEEADRVETGFVEGDGEGPPHPCLYAVDSPAVGKGPSGLMDGHRGEDAFCSRCGGHRGGADRAGEASGRELDCADVDRIAIDAGVSRVIGLLLSFEPRMAFG